MNRHLAKILLFVAVFATSSSKGQVTQVENGLFWEITGNDLRQPSYLFGTFHLMGGEYIDSLSNVVSKFRSAGTFAGEMIFDSTMTFRMMEAALMKDTTLQQLLDDDSFRQTSQWLKELSGYDLTLFNRFSPLIVEMTLLNLLQQKIYKKTVIPMDLHFQKLANGKKNIVGLETFEDQINALFKSSSYVAQAQRLKEFVAEKDKARSQLFEMNSLYRQQDLRGLEKFLAESPLSQQQKDVLLVQRNDAWMKQLPFLFIEQSTFVAVGALHLSGEHGLVTLLRNAGFTVTPISLN